jgi:hypothetical protein
VRTKGDIDARWGRKKNSPEMAAMNGKRNKGIFVRAHLSQLNPIASGWDSKIVPRSNEIWLIVSSDT